MISASAAPFPAEGSELLVCAKFHPYGLHKGFIQAFLRHEAHAYHLAVARKDNPNHATLPYVELQQAAQVTFNRLVMGAQVSFNRVVGGAQVSFNQVVMGAQVSLNRVVMGAQEAFNWVGLAFNPVVMGRRRGSRLQMAF